MLMFDKRVFVCQQSPDYRNSDPRWPRQPKTCSEPGKECYYTDMHCARNQQGAGNTEPLGNGKEAGAAVKIHILAGVEHIESTHPEGDCGAENQHAKIEMAGDSDPRCCGRNAKGKSEKEMRPVGEALGVGIEKQNGQRDRRQLQR